jgi:hypothetical protein
MYNLYYIIVPNIFSANEKGKNKYARMTEEQRTNRRKRQNTLEACQQKKNHCNMKKDALCVVYCNGQPIVGPRDAVNRRRIIAI